VNFDTCNANGGVVRYSNCTLHFKFYCFVLDFLVKSIKYFLWIRFQQSQVMDYLQNDCTLCSPHNYLINKQSYVQSILIALKSLANANSSHG